MVEAAYLTAEELAARMPDASRLLSDEPEMESSLHYLQLSILVASLEWLWRDRHDFFIGANLTVYYSRHQLRHREFRGPDFFLVRGTERRPRTSWVVWEEDGRYPDLIIELLSPSTAEVDRTEKKALYQDRFRTREYFWFSPDTLEFAGFRLSNGQYQEIPLTEDGRRFSEQLGLFLGVEEGQLRFFTPDGVLVPTPQEVALAEGARAEREHRRAEQEAARAEQEAARAERLAARLREMGVDPDQN